VIELAGIEREALERLLGGYGLRLRLVPCGTDIPSSFWGGSEAGLAGEVLFARADTPLHSVLHEAAHFACMSPQRRSRLDRDAGGDDREEEAVCYLQVLMADALPGVGRARLCADMDAWGYSFRLGGGVVRARCAAGACLACRAGTHRRGRSAHRPGTPRSRAHRGNRGDPGVPADPGVSGRGASLVRNRGRAAARHARRRRQSR